MRTPLITAIAYKRDELAKFMIDNGVSVEESIKILKEEGVPEYVNRLNGFLDR